MKACLLALLFVVHPLAVLAQTSSQKKSYPKPSTGPATQEIQTEQIQAPTATPPPATTRAGTTGYLEPEQVKALLHKLWLTQYHINDLLEQVHPDQWKKMPEAARKSFGQSLETLHQALNSEEEWRTQFDGRPDSLYLGFQTYVAINSVLPRLDGLSRSVAQYENASFGGQFSQAGNQLFDFQQALQPHLAFLMKNQDGLVLAAQTNLASCQSELGYAEHNKQGRATPMKNIAPVFKGHKRTAHAPEAPGDEKKAESDKKGTGKASTKSSSDAQQKK